MVRRFLSVLAAVVASMAVAAGAGASTRGEYLDEGGGGSSTPSVYIIQSYTVVNGYPQFLYCRYLDFGNGLVIQDSCWT